MIQDIKLIKRSFITSFIKKEIAVNNEAIYPSISIIKKLFKVWLGIVD